MLQNMLWPRLLGGVDRPYKQVPGFVSLTRLEKLAELVEERKLDVAVDSCWRMKDALKVRFRLSILFRKNFSLEKKG
jgi:hypothetical protein